MAKEDSNKQLNYLAHYYRETDNWQSSVSHIYPKYQFSAKGDGEAIAKAALFAKESSGERVKYSLTRLNKISEVNIDKKNVEKILKKGLEVELGEDDFVIF
jgi:hypothetical protein